MIYPLAQESLSWRVSDSNGCRACARANVVLHGVGTSGVPRVEVQHWSPTFWHADPSKPNQYLDFDESATGANLYCVLVLYSARMVSRVSHTTFNCTDAFQLARWWNRVLGYTDLPDDPNEPGDEECMIVDPTTGHRLLFIEVETLQEPGRVHLDPAPTDRGRDEEIARVLDLGAREVADHRRPDGTGWMIMADPEGNLFCILRSGEERSAAL